MINLTKIIAAILVLLAIALGGYAWMLGRNSPPPPVAAGAPNTAPAKTQEAPTYPVVVAARTLPAGEAIPADALRVERLTINPAGAFQDAAVVAGRVPVLDLGEGTPLLEGQMASGLALKVLEGERAVAIKADEVMGVGNKIQPGDFVDVFVMLKSDNRDIDRTQARLLLSRKRILAFGNASVDGLPSKAGDKAGSNPPPQLQRNDPARTAVLAIPVEDVNRLTLADASGRLLLALRNPSDTSQPDPKLFAELPTALQPTRATKSGDMLRAPLEGLDRAQAGLTAVDLATGGQPVLNRPATGVRPAVPGPRVAGRSGGLQVEVIRGEKSETLQY